MLINTTLQALNQLTDLFQRAAEFNARPRERLLALAEAEEHFYRLYPDHYRALQLIRVASQFAGPHRRRDGLARCESRRMALLMGIIGDAIHCGDLRLNIDRRPADLAFVLWALAFGTRALMTSQVAITQLEIRDGAETTRGFADDLMDALGWKPLSTEWDYAGIRQRVRRELFPSAGNSLGSSN
jgi:hypothetical protein